MTNGIAIPRWRDFHRMRAVQAHVADLVILHVEQKDLILLLQHGHLLNTENIRRHHRQAIEGGIRIVFAAAQHLAALLHHGRGFGLQDGIIEIAAGIGRAAKAADRPWPGSRLLKSECQPGPAARHIRDRACAFDASRWANRNCRNEEWCDETDHAKCRKLTRHVNLPQFRPSSYHSNGSKPDPREGDQPLYSRRPYCRSA